MLSKPMRGARPNRQHWSAKGLVGEWLFNEGCGTKAFDSSGNGNLGTLYNFASPTTATSGWCAGRKGGGLRFDSANDYIEIYNDFTLNPTSAISIVAWIFPITLGQNNYGRIVSKYYTQYELFLTENNKIQWTVVSEGGTTHHQYSDVNAITMNEWNHIVSIYDGACQKSYVNGVLQNQVVNWVSALKTTSTDLYIGNRKDRVRTFNGIIEEVQLYNCGWNAKQVAWDYINMCARYQPRLTLAQLRYFVELGIITDPSIESLSVNRTIKSKTIDRTFESLTPERTFNLGV